MHVDFLYGKSGLQFNISDIFKTLIIEPKEEQKLDNPIEQIYQSFLNPMSSKPLKRLLEHRNEGEIIIVVEDHTRPLPSKYIIDALSKLFEEMNISDSEIKILVATGLHRSPNSEELVRMIGEDAVNRYDVIFHDANDKFSLENVGKTTSNTPIYINSRYVNSRFKIITGYVEPHFFAGFSGGRKSLVPGIAGKETILRNHSAKNIDSINARFGILDGNPIHEDSLEAGRIPKIKPDFCINATINSNHKITKVASGNFIAVHNYLVQSQRKTCFKTIEGRYDIVICGNGGYPLDLNLYQAVKSMAIGEMAVKPNGIIIAVNECVNGVGQEIFGELINSGKLPSEIYQDCLNGKINTVDIWEIQIMVRIMMKNKIIVVSQMKKEELGNIGLIYAEDMKQAIQIAVKLLNKPENEISILIFPKGPLILPELK